MLRNMQLIIHDHLLKLLNIELLELSYNEQIEIDLKDPNFNFANTKSIVL